MPVKRKKKKRAAARKGKKKSTRKAGSRKVAKKATKRKTKAKKKTARKKTTKAKKAPRAKKGKKTKKGKKRKANPAFMRPLTVSPELAAVIGSKPIPRPQVVKKLWAYIKKNDLQDPKNRRNIIADEKLEVVFGGRKSVDMFQMTKLVSKHLT